ncbi:rhomboid family intramembrane serine protease [Apibacter muscae]|uniref:rhomboid family intramembrane serine protease n=1 Tax=Apibacter muscae TaxID=2509004 RepID=UPI0011ACF91B|nr:rhomboid family intramembrane serine protease [Apibacter muscae]TWP24404.1 rhomboid family intramembrane serine protease [Apibacter muscae]
MNRYIPPVTKNLLILNTIFFVGKFLLLMQGIDLDVVLGAFFPASPNFKWYQIISHMFMHGNFMHFVFNMFALWMFGSAVEKALGIKKYLILYFVCGLGAFVLYNLVNFYEYKKIYEVLIEQGAPLGELYSYTKLSPIEAKNITITDVKEWLNAMPSGVNVQLLFELFRGWRTPMIGASGAIYGVLVAFGMMYPNTVLMLLFPPIPMKAKFFIPIMIILELFFGFQNQPGDNVAHFAHLGGAIFGFFLVRHWLKNRYRWN